MYWRTVQSILCNFFKFRMVICNSTASTAKSKGRTHDYRVTDFIIRKRQGRLQCGNNL